MMPMSESTATSLTAFVGAGAMGEGDTPQCRLNRGLGDVGYGTEGPFLHGKRREGCCDKDPKAAKDKAPAYEQDSFKACLEGDRGVD